MKRPIMEYLYIKTPQNGVPIYENVQLWSTNLKTHIYAVQTHNKRPIIE
jgi:hypothetical protein